MEFVYWYKELSEEEFKDRIDQLLDSDVAVQYRPEEGKEWKN